MPEAIASVVGGSMQASASKKAAKTAANAQLEAARMQQEAAKEALGLGREQFEYGQEQDLYQRALQRQLAQQQAEVMNENIQPFINLGLGSISGLSRMVNPTMGIDSSLYGLAGMQPRQATNIGPTFDPSAGHGGITPINFDEMDSYIAEQLEARRQAQAAPQPQPGPTGISPTGNEVMDRNIRNREVLNVFSNAIDPAEISSVMPVLSPAMAEARAKANRRALLGRLAARKLGHGGQR